LQVAHPHASMPGFLHSAVESLAAGRLQWPLLISALSAFFLYGASDLLSQSVEQLEPRRHASYDLERMARSGVISALLSGFLAVFYFRWLEQTFPIPAVLTGPYSVLALLSAAFAKMVVDVGLYEPLFDTVYISLQSLLRGETWAATRSELRKVPKVWSMAPRYWCLVDMFNFSVVSLRLRPLTNALFSIPWSMYLTTIANDAAS